MRPLRTERWRFITLSRRINTKIVAVTRVQNLAHTTVEANDVFFRSYSFLKEEKEEKEKREGDSVPISFLQLNHCSAV